MRAIWVAAVVAVAVGASGCSSSGSPANGPTTPTVIASTDVWGSVAGAVVGDHAKVTSLLTSAVDDPHSYEATPADAAAIADASLVVFNGGGYDHWVDTVLADDPKVPSVNAYALLPESDVAAGAAPGNPEHANEHVFYDPTVAKAVATAIADKLAAVDAEHAGAYRDNAAEFARRADQLLIAERAIGQAHPGAAVVGTEPVAHYLLANAGITDKTPEAFASAAEADTDPAPADLAAMLDLISTRQVSALLYNPQTETEVTKQLRDAAAKASVPVVTVTETLPANTDYLTWQRQTVDALAAQLNKSPQPSR